ncbi:MAG: isochorismatase family protein [Phycisphaerae bacterium]
MPTHHDKLDRVHAQLVLVDVQERLLPHIHDYERVQTRAQLVIKAANLMHLPITVSEQNPERLGASDPVLMEHLEDAEKITKMTFSLCADPGGRDRLLSLMRPQVMLIGVETHVCVQQTALDLLRMQLRPFVLADAVSSRHPEDREIALARMREAGVIVTTVESAVFELFHEAGTELFRKMLPHIR